MLPECPLTEDVRSLIWTPNNTPLPAAGGPLVLSQTGTPGAVTVDATEDAWKLPIAATAEAEANRISMGGLRIPVANIKHATFRVKVSALAGTTLQAAFGICSAVNDDPDSIAEGVFFKILSDDSIVVESDDGTTDTNDLATGQTNAAAWRLYHLNFTDGIKRGDYRFGGNTGGRAIVQASISNAAGLLRPVARGGSVLDLSGYAGRVQPFVQITKSSSTDTGSLHLAEIRIDYKNTLSP